VERRISRLLATGAYVSVAILTVSVLAAVVVAQGPALSTLLSIGLTVVILTPVFRVVAAAIGFARRGEREMAAVSVGVLAVLGSSVIIASVAR
jgi:uncharacterized membrane protein